MTYLTSWSRVVLEKRIVTQLVKKFPAFVEPKGSSPCSQESVTCPYPEPDVSSPQLPNLFP